MKPPTQAERIKAIKAALSAAADMGLKVVAFHVTYAQGVPCGRELGWGEGEAETMGQIYVPDEALG